MKKGFTLIELLAVIVILAIILAIAVPGISSIIDAARNSAYVNNEKIMVKATKTYADINNSILPSDTGDINIVNLSELQSAGYISEIKDNKDNTTCTGRVVISKKVDGNYNYSPYLKCGSNYETYTSYISNGLVTYLDGYDAPSGNYWLDKSGNGYNATIVNPTATAYDTDKKGYVFDGTSYMSLSNPISSQTPSTQDWAVEAVVMVSSTSQGVQKFLISGWSDGLYLSYSSSNRLLLYLNGGSYDYYDYGYYNISNDKIEHVVFNFKYSGDLIEIYINGVDVSVNGARSSSRIPLGINSSISIGNSLKGTLYDLKIYNRHLTNSEVQYNYNVAKHLFGL